MLNNNSKIEDVIPFEFFLSQNHPNPFREKTTIKYCVAYRTRVQLTVFDSEGNIIEKLVDEEKNAGTYEVEFQLAIYTRQLAKGEYSYRLVAGEYECNKKMLLIK